jgi:hypothetical protein
MQNTILIILFTYNFYIYKFIGGCKKVLQVATAVPNVAIQQRKPSQTDVLVTPTDGAAGSSADSDQGKDTKDKVYPYALS